jgi:hypothetical protein
MDPHDHEQPLQKPGAPEGAGGPASDPTLEALEEKIKGLRQSLEELRRGAQAEEGSAPEERGEESASSEEPPGSEQAQERRTRRQAKASEGRLESRGRDQPLALFDGWRQAAGAGTRWAGRPSRPARKGSSCRRAKGGPRLPSRSALRRLPPAGRVRLEPAMPRWQRRCASWTRSSPSPTGTTQRRVPLRQPVLRREPHRLRGLDGGGRGREAGTLAAAPSGTAPARQQHPKSAALKGDGWNELVIECEATATRSG